MMESILITGGSGFIGSYFNELLSDSVVNYDLRQPIRETPEMVEIGDVRDVDRVQEVVKRHKPNSIIHLAAAHHDFARCCPVADTRRR